MVTKSIREYLKLAQYEPLQKNPEICEIDISQSFLP